MGGKVWNKEEEEYFWKNIIPKSPAAADDNGHSSWDDLAQEMKAKFGEHARRNYTWLMLYEHWYQNVKTGHVSPKGLLLVAQYKKQLAIHGKPAGVVKPGKKIPARRTAATGLSKSAGRPAQKPSRNRGSSKPRVDNSTASAAAVADNTDCGVQESTRTSCPAPNLGIHRSFILHAPAVETQGWTSKANTEDSTYGSVASAMV